MRTDYINIIDKVNAKSITAEVVDIENPFHVEFKESLIFNLQIKLTDTAYEFCKHVYENLHKIDVVNGLGTTFENLIITAFTIIIDSEGYRFRDILDIKFVLVNENENTDKKEDTDTKEDTTMLNLYLCTPETCYLDEYSGFVVLAENKSEAFKMVTDENDASFDHTQGYITIEKVDMNKKGIVLDSFNAG